MNKVNIYLIAALVLAVLTSSCGGDDYVVIDGVKWATRNVGAPGKFVKNPEDLGMYYQWNSHTGWSATDPLISTDGSSWNSNWNGNSASIWESANDPCPPGWRMPTLAELVSLRNAAGSVWASVNGVNGYLFGSGANSIFLPATGFRSCYNGTVYGIGTWGSYWSDTVDGATSRGLYFNSSDAYTYLNSRAFGLSCRCVAE